MTARTPVACSRSCPAVGVVDWPCGHEGTFEPVENCMPLTGGEVEDDPVLEGLLPNMEVVDDMLEVVVLESKGNWASATRTQHAATTQKTLTTEKLFIFSYFLNLRIVTEKH